MFKRSDELRCKGPYRYSLLTVQQAAELLALPKLTLTAAIQSGKLKCVQAKKGGRRYLRYQDLAEWCGVSLRVMRKHAYRVWRKPNPTKRPAIHPPYRNWPPRI